MVWRKGLSWKTYPYRQNEIIFGRTTLEVNWLLLMETNVNLVSLYDNEFNKLTFEILEKHGEPHKLNCCLCFVGTQITSKAHSSYDFFKCHF